MNFKKSLDLSLENIHVTGKAFAGGKGFRGLCRLPAAKQTSKTANENGENCNLYRHKLCNFADNKVMKVKKNDLVKKKFQAMFILTLILTFNFMASNPMANITIVNMENRVKI